LYHPLSKRSSPMIRTRMLLAFAAMTLLLAQAPVQAGGLVMSMANVTGPTAGQGSFEVLLTNPSGGQSVDVASYSFALMVPMGAGVQFTAADTSPLSAPYVFEGTGGASVDPGFMLSLDSFPNTSFTGSDTEFTFPSIMVNPGNVFGLGLISYSVGPSAPGGDVPISFISSGTSLSDASGTGIDLTTDDRAGVIHIAGSAVPEPSSLVLIASAIGMMLLSRGYQQARKRSTR
ncbi:MAG: PEP-CTERM sorting domain-containing protein, partial [Isosphaeraceae bacterium]